MVLYLHQVPARQGVLWVKHGFSVFRRSPFAMTALISFAMLVGLLPAALFPPLQIISLALPPFVSLAFMLATHRVVQGQRPTLTVFLEPWRITAARRRTLLLLCLGYGAIVFGASLLADQLDGGAAERLQQVLAQANPDIQTLEKAWSDPGLLASMGTLFGTVALLAIPFWHAPALVHWGAQGAAQALFSSTLAVWRNRGAFFRYMLIWFGLALLVSAVLGPLTSLAGPLGGPLFMVAGTMMSAVFSSSLYFTFLDCFLSGVPADLNQSA